jgi:signal transduction histidine kinase
MRLVNDSRRGAALVMAATTAAWLVLALAVGMQGYVAAAYRGRPMPLAQALVYPLVFYAVWALLTPAIVWLAGRFPPRRSAGFVAVHVVASVAVALSHARGFVFVLSRIQPDVWAGLETGHVVMNAVVANIHSNVLLYWIVAGGAWLIAYYRRSRERDMRAAQLEARLAQAELQVLKMQLHPHFLFNTLHAVSALVHEDPEAADRMLSQLGDLLRATLAAGEAQEVPLGRELEFVDRYLDIERQRLGDRLQVDRDIDGAALDALVPSLLLQPLVENAIRHGIAPSAAGGTIRIRARCESGALRLEVSDDGEGCDPDRLAPGLGLSNTRARLTQLYGPAHRLSVTGAAGAGVRVDLTLPHRPVPAAGGH